MEKKEYTYNLFDFMKIMEEEVKYNHSGEAIIKSVKGNIPIDYSLFGKYKSVSEIFDQNLNTNFYILSNINFTSIKKIEEKNIKQIARNIFHSYHNTNIFYNQDNKIYVTDTGIDESIHKIIRSIHNEKELHKYLIILANLGNIIKNARLINQSCEIKSRSKYIHWNYYLIGLFIQHNRYLFIFDVVSMDNGENHYRVGRIKKIDISHGDASNDTRILPLNEISISDNNIT